jgi:hypothetical protein
LISRTIDVVLSLPVLLRIFPQGLDEDDPEHRRELRLAYEEWLASRNQGGLSPDPAIHHAWVRYVLTRTLQLPEEVIAEGQAIPQTLKATLAEHGETLRPDLVIFDPSSPLPLSEANSPAPLPRLLSLFVFRFPGKASHPLSSLLLLSTATAMPIEKA